VSCSRPLNITNKRKLSVVLSSISLGLFRIILYFLVTAGLNHLMSCVSDSQLDGEDLWESLGGLMSSHMPKCLEASPAYSRQELS
jgi:hypothetical protein